MVVGPHKRRSQKKRHHRHGRQVSTATGLAIIVASCSSSVPSSGLATIVVSKFFSIPLSPFVSSRLLPPPKIPPSPKRLPKVPVGPMVARSGMKKKFLQRPQPSLATKRHETSVQDGAKRDGRHSTHAQIHASMIVPKKKAPNVKKNCSVQKSSRAEAPSEVSAPDRTETPMWPSA